MIAAELRIGNYVWDDYSTEMIVEGLTSIDKISLMEKGCPYSGSY